MYGPYDGDHEIQYLCTDSLKRKRDPLSLEKERIGSEISLAGGMMRVLKKHMKIMSAVIRLA